MNLNYTNETFRTLPEYTLGLNNRANFTTNNIISNTNTNTNINTNEEDKCTLNNNQQKKKKKISAPAIATTILVASILSLVFAKGYRGSSKLSELAEKLSNNINNNKKVQGIQKVINNASKKSQEMAKVGLDTLQATSNFTAFKDSYTDEILQKTAPTRKFAIAIRTKFKNIVNSRLANSYSKVNKPYINMTSVLKQNIIPNIDSKFESQVVKIDGKEKTVKELTSLLEKYVNQIEQSYTKNFTPGAILERDKKISNALVDISKKVKNNLFGFKNIKKFCKNKEYTKYITETLSKNATGNIIDDILSAQKQITNTSGKQGAIEHIDKILQALNETNPEIITNKQLLNIQNVSKNFKAALNNATKLETTEFIMKRAELEVGSAPTDIISILFPATVGAIAIAKGDNKDEKVSATLTTGIPLVGTIAAFVYGTLNMFSGAKSIIFSAVTGTLLNKLGSYSDKLHKKYKKTGSVTEVAKQETDKILTDLKPDLK